MENEENVKEEEIVIAGQEDNASKIRIADDVVAIIAGKAVSEAPGVYAMAKKSNPAVTLKKLNYSEKDVLLIGAGSVLGGLTGGYLSDKNEKNKKAKLREASQQFFGNIACPVGLLAVGNKLLDKTKFKLPKINSSSKPAQIINAVTSVLPKVVVTVASLVGGMELGNKIMNKVNNKIFKEDVKHNVKAEDYLVHADDICLTANMLLKDARSISVLSWPFTEVVIKYLPSL